ncbi:BnaC03g42840D [Brassica napus]|uniref:BnaC03g42840D protein n=1 Tax=Brassica napus TaxID=3708 RepID=A0A078GG05_BRANA|nr:BnaC03g42840D [Brassica napus]
MSFAMGRASGGREESVGRPRFSQKSRELAHLPFHLVSQSNVITIEDGSMEEALVAERLMIVHEEHLRVLPKRKTLFVC